MFAQRCVQSVRRHGEMQDYVAFGRLGGHIGVEIVRKDHPVAGTQPPSGPGEGAPAATAHILVQGHLDRRRAARSPQTHRNHPGVVHHQKIAGPQRIREIRNPTIGETVSNDQQTRRIARRTRTLRDARLRQLEVESIDGDFLTHSKGRRFFSPANSRGGYLSASALARKPR